MPVMLPSETDDIGQFNRLSASRLILTIIVAECGGSRKKLV